MAAIAFAVIAGGWTGYLTGGGLLMSSTAMFLNARELRRRQQLHGTDALPEAGDDILALVRQGRKIEAIKLYRELHPGMGLREARVAVDERAKESTG